MPTQGELKLYQSLPLEFKVAKTQLRILEWVKEFGQNGIYVSFSGGKDSTVLLHLVREIFPETEAVFVDTGLEYPEVKEFAKSFENVTVLRPKMNFAKVIQTYGYPIISKEVASVIEEAKIGLARRDGSYQFRIDRLNSTGRYAPKNGVKSRYDISKYKPLLSVDFNVSARCCKEMKKSPAMKFEKTTKKTAILGTMTEESALRCQRWLKYGCNAFENKNRQTSNPLSFWIEQDVLRYIQKNDLKIASVYGDIVMKPYSQNLCTTGCDRTGCVFCGFGVHLERGENRYQRLKQTHPKLYQYCIYGGAYDSDGLWKPDKNGLGMGHVFDSLNEIYGENFIRYE